MRSVLVNTGIASAFVALSITTSAHAADADELAKALSNPVAALISVPLQLNYDTGYAGGGERWTLNAQPVIPVDISKDWNLISRTIVPGIYQNDVGTVGSDSGLGDIVQSLFFSPKEPTADGWILGAGPVLLLPTATDTRLGAEKWGLGPTGVALKQTKSGWTYGALVNHIWSFAGDHNRADVNATFIQPFLAKSLGGGRTVSMNMENTYDWETKQWNAPVNLLYAKVTKIGSQLINLQGGVRGYVDSPPGGPDWGLRFAITFMFPK